MAEGGLDQLFSQMRQRNSGAQGGQGQNYSQQQANPYFGLSGSHGAYHQPSVSSPLPTPPVNNQPPHHASAIVSPVSEYPSHRQTPSFGTPTNQKAQHTNSLLNLLKFSSPTQAAPNQPTPIAVQNRAPSQSNGSTSDLMATFLGNTSSKENEALSARLRAAANKEAKEEEAAKAPSAETQNYLLQLLNRPKPAQTEQPLLHKSTSPTSKPGSLSARGDTQAEIAVLTDTLHKTTLEKTTEPQGPAKASQGLFTYTNPFDDLAASSPRRRTPKPTTPAQSSPAAPIMQILKPSRDDATDVKRKLGERSPVSSPAHTKAKLNPSTPSPMNGRPLEPTSSTATNESVTAALEELSEHVGKEVEQVLAVAEDDVAQAVIENDLRHMLDARSRSEFESNAQAAASAIKKELEKDGNQDILTQSLPGPVAEVVKVIVDDVAKGEMPDSWESEESPAKDDDIVVKVYNFPMKPWISIAVTPDETHQLSLFKDDEIFDVARLKKEFDQVDRTLVTASTGFVVYGMSKNGGMRVIRQLDGKDMKLFEETRDRVFNVSISTASNTAAETAIGTGVSGTVYWADLRAAEGEYIQDASSEPNNHGFALPPIPSPGEETSGGMLKTRARKSSSHPEFFAVGRGKSIHIIWPAVITKQSYLKKGKERLVDTEKYLQHQSLKINTGKAGKDFIFSQDDTTIVSLDKAGKVKFWDVQTLTHTARGTDPRIPTPEQIKPIEIKEPILAFNTTRENTKAWPTSVQFIDKLRPYQKGGPLRYLLVGMKQNHTLQLWDLVLRRAVQEIKLPHEKESDAVCSIVYHPTTGILAVGHPTRNSIFFIHVSAPKYDAPKTCSQAEFMQRLANKDPSIPQPKSTAVMSGIREYSFGSKGQLRSLDMLQSPTTASEDPDNPVLFELYTMHSKGVTYLAIKQEDMGWNKDHRVILPVDAAEEKMIMVESLKEVSNQESSAETASPKPTPNKISPRDPSPKDAKIRTAEVNAVLEPTTSAAAAMGRAVSPTKVAAKAEAPAATKEGQQEIQTATDKPEKRKKKGKAAAQQALLSATKELPVPAISSRTPENVPANSATGSTSAIGLSEEVISGVIRRLEAGVSTEVSKLVTASLDALHKRIDNDRRAQAAQGIANQEAVIRMVAQTLDANIDKKLEQTIKSSVETFVVPAVSQVALKAVNEQLSQQLSTHLKQNLGKELRTILPDAVTKSLHQAEVLKLMSNALAGGVQFKVEEHFTALMKKTVIPSFTNLAVQAAQQATVDVQRAATDQIDRQAREYDAKIEKLAQVVTTLTETVSSMAASQSKFQDHFLKLQQPSQSGPSASSRAPSTAGVPRSNAGNGATTINRQQRPAIQQKSEAEIAMDQTLTTISQLMTDSNYEEACMHWLQGVGEEQREIFDRYFAKLDPSFAHELSPLMLLSVASVVTSSLEGPTLLERLSYVETVLRDFSNVAGSTDEGTNDVIPRIMSLIVQRLESLFVRINNVSPEDAILRRLSAIITTSKRISSFAQNSHISHQW